MIAFPPERIEYVCPVCKKKTIHTKWENVGPVEYINGYHRQIGYRQQIKRIKELGVDAMLDETDLCNQCRLDKTTETTDFYIVVTVEGRSVRTQLEEYDLEKVIAFLEKKDVWGDIFEETRPLKDELPRIRKILGMDGGEEKTAK